MPKSQRVLFLRRWLSLEMGEAPSPVQAACWLEIKRAYMALRPNLRRVYGVGRDLGTFAPVLSELGFHPNEEADVKLDGVIYHAVMLDFGPASVDGWPVSLLPNSVWKRAVYSISTHGNLSSMGYALA